MFNKRIKIFLIAILTLTFIIFAVGCENETTDQELAPIDQQNQTEQISEDELLTQAAIDYFTYMQGTNMIEADKLHEGLSNLYVIDIRSAEDFAKGHIPEAVNIPMKKMGEEIPNLPTDTTLVIVCYSGQTASQTTGVLRMAGFDVLSLKGGFPSWEKAEFEIQN